MRYPAAWDWQVSHRVKHCSNLTLALVLRVLETRVRALRERRAKQRRVLAECHELLALALDERLQFSMLLAKDFVIRHQRIVLLTRAKSQRTLLCCGLVLIIPSMEKMQDYAAQGKTSLDEVFKVAEFVPEVVNH